jgi:hypothetical protein
MVIWAEFGGWRPSFGWPVGRFRVKKRGNCLIVIKYCIIFGKATKSKMAQIPLSYYTVPFNAVSDNEDTTTINYVHPVTTTELFLMPYVSPQVLMQLDGVMLHAEVAMHRLEIANDTESDSSDEDVGPILPAALVVLPAVVIPNLPAVVKTITKTITEIVTVESNETISETVTETVTETITTRKAKRVCHRACLI